MESVIAGFPQSVMDLMGTAADLTSNYPLRSTLVVLIAADIVMGMLAAIGLKTLNSTTSWKGMTRKGAMLIIVGMAWIIEPLVGFPLGKIVTLFYIATEATSCVENAGLLGVPLPQPLVDVLYKLREPGIKENARLAAPLEEPQARVQP